MSERHPSSLEFHRVLRKMAETHDKKQADYGRADDPFANVRSSADFGIAGWVGCMVRANDKMARIKTAAMQVVAGGDVQLANESLEDSLLDLANYAVIGLVLLRQEQANGGTTPPAPEPCSKGAHNHELDRYIESFTEQRAAVAWAKYAHAALSASPAVNAGDADDEPAAQADVSEAGLDGAAVHDRTETGRSVTDATHRPGHSQPFARWLAQQHA